MGYFFVGFVFWLPIGIIVLIGDQIFGGLDPLGKDLLGTVLPDRFLYSGTGMSFWILIMFLTGILLKSTPVGRLASSIPIVGTLFLRMDQKTITLDRLMNMAPCLFLYSPTCISYGWILSEQEVKLDNEKAAFHLINVYYPNVPTLVTGQVFTAREETVMKLGNPSRDIVDVLLYGLRRPSNLRYLPWEDESEQKFKERAERFGVWYG